MSTCSADLVGSFLIGFTNRNGSIRGHGSSSIAYALFLVSLHVLLVTLWIMHICLSSRVLGVTLLIGHPIFFASSAFVKVRLGWSLNISNTACCFSVR